MSDGRGRDSPLPAGVVPLDVLHNGNIETCFYKHFEFLLVEFKCLPIHR